MVSVKKLCNIPEHIVRKEVIIPEEPRFCFARKIQHFSSTLLFIPWKTGKDINNYIVLKAVENVM